MQYTREGAQFVSLTWLMQRQRTVIPRALVSGFNIRACSSVYSSDKEQKITTNVMDLRSNVHVKQLHKTLP